MSETTSAFDTVEDAIRAIAEGQLVIVVDDEDRENEGDLIMAASKATPETINMMIRYGSGIVCVPMTGPQLDRLGLGPMVAQNREVQRTAFTVSVDAAAGITTGVSAYDRALCIRLLAEPDTRPDQLVQPGHVFPLRSRPGGVLERAGHTEAAVDLAQMAGLPPSGVLCELVNDDGTMQRLPQLIEFKRRFGLRLISIEQLIAHRAKREVLVEKIGEQPFASAYGDFTAHVFRNRLDRRHHLALTLGVPGGETPALVRVQSANPLADVFRGQRCGGRGVMDACMLAIARAGHGAVLYMEPANAGQALLNRLTPAAHDDGPAMDLRDYGIGAQILGALGLNRIRLLSSSQRKVIGLDGYGIELVEQVPIPME